MTFQQARMKHLESLEAAWKRLWQLAGDPTWLNKDCKEYAEIKKDFERSLLNIIALNNAEAEATR